MKNTMKKIAAMLMVFALSAVLFASCGKSGTDGKIVIGGVGPLTGDYAQYGNAVKNGAAIAIEELNAAGGVAGIKFELLFEDSQADAESAVSAFGKMLDNGMNVSLGGTLSGETKAIVDSDETGMLILTPTGSAVNCISESNAFRVCFNDPQQGEVAAQAIKDNAMGTKIALFYDKGLDYSIGNIETFKKKAAELGIEIVAEETFTSTTSTDFSTQITAIKNSGADMVFMPIYYGEAARFLRQASGVLNTVFFGVDGLDGIVDECKANPEDAEGVMLLTPFYANAKEGVTKKFVDAYKAKFNSTPSQFAADGYDAVLAVAAAVKEAGITSETFASMSKADFNAKVIEAMTKIQIEGATGITKWSADGETTKVPQVLVVKNGEYEVYTKG